MQDGMDIHSRLNVLDCFSGYGGFALGLRLAYPDADFRTVAYIEWDKYCQQVIQARINDRLLDDAPVWGGDIREFDGKSWRGVVDIITASPPCPSFSVAGNRLGGEDDRNMFPETLRLADAYALGATGVHPELDRSERTGEGERPQRERLRDTTGHGGEVVGHSPRG
jgi:hypothetical protein